MTSKPKKKKKHLILLFVLLVLLAVVVAIAWVPVSSYLAGRFAPVKAEAEGAASLASSEAASLAISDEELNKLISGEASLEEFETNLFTQTEEGEAASASSEEAASSEAAESESAASSEEAASSPAASSSASSASSRAASASNSSSSSSSSKNTSSSSSSSSTAQEAEYEKEVKALLQELYTLRAQAMADLNACIDSAWTEYMALPEEQRTPTNKLSKKLSITFSKAGELAAMQSYYDKEVDRIVSEMRTILTENGQSTELADQALASYKKEKSDTYAACMAKLYS